MYQRHTNLFISFDGRKRIYQEALEQGFCGQDCGALLLPEQYLPDVELANIEFTNKVRNNGVIPAIVRREENKIPDGMIAVGFSSWRKADGRKIRLPAFVAADEVIGSVTPVEILQPLRQSNQYNSDKIQRTKSLKALIVLLQAEQQMQATTKCLLGVWGSAAMELLTGYLYTHEESDLDIMLLPNKDHQNMKVVNDLFSHWYNLIEQVQTQFAIRIDVEISLPNGYGVSLKEIFNNGRTVLGKGLTDVVLFPKNQVFDCLVRL